MLVNEETREVVMRIANPECVLNIVPGARTMTHKGITLTVAPHDLDTVRVLRNIGVDAPGPASFYYRWPGRFTPFKAQKATVEFMTLNKKAFVLNDMGTAKTLSTLWAFDYLRSLGEVKKMLVAAPLSTLERTWGDEIFTHLPHLKFVVVHGTAAFRKRTLAHDVDVYIINHDGLKTMQDDIVARKDIDVIVLDELAVFRNAKSGKWKAANKVLAGRKVVWGLTGTPTPNEPTDAWAQVRLINPTNVPPYFGVFRDMTMKQMSQFQWKPRPNATEIVARAMQPSIRFSREQCVDLPPCLYQTRHVPLTPDAQKVYKDMSSKMAAEFDGQQALAVNEAVKLQKLIQIACGVVYDERGNEMAVPCGPRTQEVLDTIEQSNAKVIVFVPFRSALELVASEVRKHHEIGIIHGGVSKHARDEVFSAFQKGSKMKVIVAQPAAMSHGLTLTAADTVVWYAPITSNETYEQANARVTRPGQLNHQLVVNIEGTEAERRIYRRLQNKQAMQGVLLDILKG
jgi:SNF2 family DNA or RNA helicase